MKVPGLFMVGIMLTTSFMRVEWVLAAEPVYPDGVIKLFENPDGGGSSCSIAFKTGEYEMSSTGNCKNDQYSYFQLDNVASASKYRLSSEGSCDKTPGDTDWAYTFRTYIQPTTTAIISIVDASNSSVGIISKGVLLDNKHYKGGNIKGKLSCVEICRSGDKCDFFPDW